MFSDAKSTIAAYLNWWQDAGLTCPVGDAPCVWLAPAVASAPAPAPTSAPASAPVAAPPVHAETAPHAASGPQFADLAAFDAWLAAGQDLPMAAWSRQAALPQGGTGSIMLIGDFPDAADIVAGQIFSGEQGSLIGAMLRAIDIDPAAARLASISLTRPPSLRLEGPEARELAALARQHIALAQPRALILLGPGAAKLLSGVPDIPPAESQPVVNHDGGKVAWFMTHHPRSLLQHQPLKRHAWDVLKRVREYLVSC
ncbi:MAG: hypothetical protein IT553_06645 [Sphingomonadaceae bacterium]|nr:hypothetical protein [Sphingomonadaceae bacterium]